MKDAVGSQIATTSSFAPFFTKSVTSYENGICPPSCGTHSSRPFTYTIARKSACSKWRRRRSPVFTSASNDRLYQSVSFGSTSRPTPESELSITNGTRISPDHFAGHPGASFVTAYCQRPFRLVQFARAICGRGYSRQAFSGVIFSPHGVFMPGTCCQAPTAAAASAAAARIDRFIYGTPLVGLSARRTV